MAEEGLQGFVVPPRPATSPPVMRAPRARRPAAAGAGEGVEGAAPENEPQLQESEEDVKRHYQSYHDHYYGITPRDPRLAVPLKPIYPDPPSGNGATSAGGNRAPTPSKVIVNASDLVDGSVADQEQDDQAGSPLSLPGGSGGGVATGGVPQHPPSSVASANASATSFPSGAKTPESINLLNESQQSARQQIANAGTSNMPPKKSPATRSLTKSPGHTHQPYATTPVTPNDMLPSGLLQSPAQLSLEAGRQQLQQSQQQQQQQGGPNPNATQPQATLFGAPVLQVAAPPPVQHQYQIVHQQAQQQQQQVPPQPQVQDQQQQQQQWRGGSSGPHGSRGGQQGGGRGRGRGGGDINHASQQMIGGGVNNNANGSGGINNNNNNGSNNGISVQKSARLQTFHDDPAKGSNLTLLDLTNHIIEFASDQDGSRLIQRLMVDEATSDMVLAEVLPKATDLMIDVFGNYVIQRLLETGNQGHRSGLVTAMKGHVVRLSLQTYGCRVVQKALHYATESEQETIARELDGSVADCVRDQNGNHVVQKCIEMMPTGCAWLADSFVGNLPGLASHAYGCRVMQRLFERCPNNHPSIETVVTETLKHTDTLVNDQYGNYVIQHILINGSADWRTRVHMQLKDRFGNLSCSKFSSNATEKLFVHADDNQRAEIVDIVTKIDGNGTCPFVFMIQDQFANYVVQKVIDLSSPDKREQLISAIKPSLEQIKKYTYGKHLLSRFEKMGLLPPGTAGPIDANERHHHGGGGGRGRGGRGGGGRGRGRGGGGAGGPISDDQQQMYYGGGGAGYQQQQQMQQQYQPQPQQYHHHQQQQQYHPSQQQQQQQPMMQQGGYIQQIQYHQQPQYAPPPQAAGGQQIQYIQSFNPQQQQQQQQFQGGSQGHHHPQPSAVAAPQAPQPIQASMPTSAGPAAPMPAGQ